MLRDHRGMSDLFSPQPPKADPREKRCADCKGKNAHCGDRGQWYCVGCVHPSYWPKNREGA